MPKAGILIALTAGVVMLVAGANPWLALGVVLAWTGSVWLMQPAPDFQVNRERKSGFSVDLVSSFLEPLASPLLLLDRDRIIVGNRAARDALGAHIVNQDVRVALRHPAAIALVSGDGPAEVTVQGLTATKSVWRLRRHRIDSRHLLLELTDGTSEADISKAHTDFVANASHELRTPLASILGYLETLTDQAEDIPPELRQKFLGTMESEARRMRALVEDLMSLSRIEAEKHDLPRETIDLSAIARGIARDVASINGNERITFSGDDTPVSIVGERSQIDQLLRNLVDNAIKYGNADAPVAINIATRQTKAILTVSDQGPGIESEHLPLLTRRFYRTDPGRSRASGGTGLGLAIVKHIVERHRGDLSIASKVGEGTTVTVSFPLADQPS